MKKLRLLVLALALIAASALAQDTNQTEPPPATIGVVLDGPWDRNDEIAALFTIELTELLASDYTLVIPEDKTVVGDWTAASVDHALSQLLDDPEVDVILALGPIAADLACRRQTLASPVIAPFVIDIALQDLPFDGVASGMTNLTYVAPSSEARRGLQALREVVEFENIVLIQSRRIVTAIPELGDKVLNQVEQMGLAGTLILADTSAAEALAQIPSGSDAAFITFLENFSPQQYDQLVQGLIERRLPSFSIMGKGDVERGILMGLGDGLDFRRVARRTALNVQRILMGENAATIPVMLSTNPRMRINMSTARAIGVSPDWGVLTEAELISEKRQQVTRVINFRDALREAALVNLDLAAKTSEVLAETNLVGEARANLLPQIDVSATGVIIDDDRAEASMGSQAERTLSGSACVTQAIFSEAAWANHSVQKSLALSRESELQALRLDVMLEAAVAYLNVLSAGAMEDIQKNNLRLTRSNLELARIRHDIGVSGPGEVYRLESQLASNRTQVVAAQANRNVAEIALNRVLRHPAEEPFLTAEVATEDHLGMLQSDRLEPYMNDKWSFRKLRAFAVIEAHANSPELATLDAAIAAQNRAAQSASRAFWVPTLAMSGEVSKVFERGGVGSSGGSALADMIPGGLPAADDVNWSLGLNLSLPLFEGGRRFAVSARAKESVTALTLQRQAAADKIEQQARSALHVAGSSRAAIQFTRAAAEAAQKNLELVTDGYSRGVASLLDLLDAQNASLVADQYAANAVFQFLKDLMNVERACGKFYTVAPREELDSLFSRIEQYFLEFEGTDTE